MELLLNLPIWLIMIVATVKFGGAMSDKQQISLASRVGAREAAQTVGLPNTGEVPPNIVQAIQRQLHNAGLACSKVILEHNVGAANATLVSGGDARGRPNIPLPSLGLYVRVTVFSKGIGQSTTFLYERCPEAG